MNIVEIGSSLDFMTSPGENVDSYVVKRQYPHSRTRSSRSFSITPSSSFSRPASSHSHTSHGLPPELWLDIFSNLSSQTDISNVTLTCTTFCTLAQPLLFATLDVCPFHLGYNGSGPILRSHAYLKRTKERIALYTSNPKIRSNVRTVWVSPYPRNASTGSGAAAGAESGKRDYLDPGLVIEEVVSALEKFPNLSSLSWHAVEMKWEWWSIISRLKLSSLWINASAFPAIGPPPSPSASPAAPTLALPSTAEDGEEESTDDGQLSALPVRELFLDHWAYNGALMNHVSVAEAHSPGVQLDILTLTIVPSIIETISVPRPSTAHWVVELVSQYGYQGVTFEKLTSLSLPYSAFTGSASGSTSASAIDDLFKAFEACPNLEDLQIFEPPSAGRSRSVVLPPLPNHTLPQLHTFEGPYGFTPVFVDGRRPVQKLVLWGLDGSGTVCDTGKLEPVLRDLAHTDVDCRVESLRMNVSTVTGELMEALGEFRGLKFLSLSSGTGDISNGSAGMSEGFANFGVGAGRGPVFALYDLLRATHLPPRLESLKISTRLDSHHSGGLDAETQQTEALELIESLKIDNPRLENVEIAYGSYWMGNYCVKWNKNATRAGRPQFDANSRKRFSSIVWEGSNGEAGTKEIIEVNINDIQEGAVRRRRESGASGLIGWISRLMSYLL